MKKHWVTTVVSDRITALHLWCSKGIVVFQIGASDRWSNMRRYGSTWIEFVCCFTRLFADMGSYQVCAQPKWARKGIITREQVEVILKFAWST